MAGTTTIQITDEQQAFADIWDALMRIAKVDGVVPLNKHEGLWRCTVDGRWVFWVNGHREPISVNEIKVLPYQVYVEYNGWPAGSFDPHAGVIAAGEAANVFTFRDAMRKRADTPLGDPTAKDGER